MTARQLRRAAEHKARKLARKQQGLDIIDVGQVEAVGQVENLRPVVNRPSEDNPTPIETTPADQLSKARLTANRANSQLSTGPTTAEGKSTSSRNSFKHGLYSKAICTPSENPADLDALKADLIAEHQPATETEAILVNELAEQFWRIRRAREYEAIVLETGFDIARLNAIQRLMSSAERGFHKALNVLRQLQSARGFVPQNAADSHVGFVPQNAADSHVGFVPQNAMSTQSRKRQRPLVGFASFAQEAASAAVHDIKYRVPGSM